MTESTELTDQASTAELSRYAIHYQPLFQPLQAMEVQRLIDTVEAPWMIMIEKAGIVVTGD